MHEPKLSKGKVREDTHWQLGWWDICNALEGTRRPMVWAKSSIIFTAHPSQPQVLGRHFPSSRQFALPSPPLIMSSSASYEPPSLISVHPGDDWLFAYFPGYGVESLGCLWKRASQLDHWEVRGCWPYAAGAAVVAVDWSSVHREWVTSEAGSSRRLPPRGPITPALSSTLILITQDHHIQICVLLPSAPHVKFAKASLLHASTTPGSDTSESRSVEHGGVYICAKAAIGMNYGESTLLVATRSHLSPSGHQGSTVYTPMDLDLSTGMPQPAFSEFMASSEWELWGEDSSISLCEVYLALAPTSFSLGVRPLPSITCVDRHLTDLTFFSGYPPAVTEVTDAPKEFRRHGIYLFASFIDFENYSDNPKSNIRLFSITSHEPSSGDGVQARRVRQEWERYFEDACLAFLLPWPARNTVLAGLVDFNGTSPHRKRGQKETPIGRIKALKIPELTEAEGWDSPPLMSHINNAGREIPANAAISPNHALLCTLPPSSHIGTPLSIHALPRHHEMHPNPEKSNITINCLSRSLVNALRQRSSPSDVIHALAISSVSLETVVSTLGDAMSFLERDSYGQSDMWTVEILGVITEVFRERSRQVEDETMKADLSARAKAAHDICSLSACCSAFDDCQEDDVYDLDAVWQLVGLSSWLIEFMEKLLKACILAADRIAISSPIKNEDLQTIADPALDSAIFLHLAHPYPLAKLQASVTHVKRFRDYVASLSAKGENAQIAKDVLIDLVDCSGINLELFRRLLVEVLQEAKTTSVEDLRRCLSTCFPVPSGRYHLRRSIEKLLKSEIVDRPRLFIKPADLVDGVTRLSLSERLFKEKDTDVVSKGLLSRVPAGNLCVRCGGRSDAFSPPRDRRPIRESLRWSTWVADWHSGCICGGLWMRV